MPIYDTIEPTSQLVNYQHSVLKASAEVTKALFKTKVHVSTQHALGQSEEYTAHVQFNAGLVKPFSDGQKLRGNDAFYLDNFKGISNLGYFYDESGEK